MKAVIIGVFALAVCWGVGRFVNLSGVAIAPAGVPISWAMMVFAAALGLTYSRVK